MTCMRVVVVATGLVLGSAGALRAQLCAPDASLANLKAGVEVSVAGGHDRLDLVDAVQNGTVVSGFTAVSVTGGKWTPTPASIQELQAARTAADAQGKSLFLRGTGPAGVAECTRTFSLASTAPPPGTLPELPGPKAGAPARETAWEKGQCGMAASRWREEIRKEVGSDHFTQLVFLQDRGICYRNRDYGVTGDPIYVGVFTDDVEAWDEVSIQFEPCAIESAAPAILVTDQAALLDEFQNLEVQWRLRTYPPRTCFNEKVAITVTGRVDGKEVTARTTLEQAQRYRATLHLGTLFTELHDRSFGLRPDGANQRIFGKGPTDRGPEYYAAVVLYALPRYLPSLVGGPRYRGRDVVHDNDLLDRIGGVVGVGISDPRKQFVAGFAFEALAGVNLTGTWNVARVTKLTDVREGDVFTGTAEQIPTRQEWDTEFVLGLSLDLRYVAALTRR